MCSAKCSMLADHRLVITKLNVEQEHLQIHGNTRQPNLLHYRFHKMRTHKSFIHYRMHAQYISIINLHTHTHTTQYTHMRKNTQSHASTYTHTQNWHTHTYLHTHTHTHTHRQRTFWSLTYVSTAYYLSAPLITSSPPTCVHGAFFFISHSDKHGVVLEEVSTSCMVLTPGHIYCPLSILGMHRNKAHALAHIKFNAIKRFRGQVL